MARRHVASEKLRIPEIDPKYVARLSAINALTGYKKDKACLKYLVSDTLDGLLVDSTQGAFDDRRQRFYRPTKQDLKELDDLISSLAKYLRKRDLTFDEAVAVVDKRWPSVKLAHLVKRLVERQHELELPAVERSPAMKHLDRIEELAAGKTPKSTVARDFLRDHKAIRDGKTLPLINWSKYRDLLCDEDTSLIRLENDSIPQHAGESLVYYTKYLELHLRQLLWEKAEEEWERENEKRRPLSDWFERNRERDVEVERRRGESSRAVVKTFRARWRKQKERFKKKRRFS